jgi:hypothetical protein
MSQVSDLDSVNNPRHPFGLPMGSVRGIFSLLICAFFWMILLWPSDQIVKPLLGHFFLLALVLLAFASSPKAGAQGESNFLPWLLRVLFVGGSVAVVFYALFKAPDHFNSRLTPDVEEFKAWWGTFLAIMSGGFASGLFLRFILGRENVVFLTLRAWLSVVGMVMLALEFAFVMAFNSAENKPDDFLRYWQAFELAIVSAYFGTRA